MKREEEYKAKQQRTENSLTHPNDEIREQQATATRLFLRVGRGMILVVAPFVGRVLVRGVRMYGYIQVPCSHWKKLP